MWCDWQDKQKAEYTALFKGVANIKANVILLSFGLKLQNISIKGEIVHFSVTIFTLSFFPFLGSCPQTCKNRKRPVCGSDGTNYNNVCELEQAMCNDPTISLAYYGACSDSYVPPPKSISGNIG